MNDDGYTYPELILSLAILSAISLILYRVFFSFAGSYDRSQNISSESEKILITYSHIEAAVGKVLPDWREENVPLSHNGNEYRFSWYEGVEGNSLILQNVDENLRIITIKGGKRAVIHQMKDITIMGIKKIYSDKIPYCLEIRISSGDADVSFVIPLSTIPLLRGEI